MYGVGPVIAHEVVRFFIDKNNQRMLDRLIDEGIRYESVETERDDQLAGEIFVFTGALTRMTREEAEAEVKRRGAKATRSVSSKTTIVVAGEKAGSKLAKAQKLGIRVMDEDEFCDLIGI